MSKASGIDCDIGFSKDELIAPTFLNQKFFENILKSFKNDKNLKISDFLIKPGTKTGEHFASIMFKVSATYLLATEEKQVISLIVKTMPIKYGLKMDILQNTPFFETEIGIYSETLPEMQRNLATIGDDEQLAPKVIYHSLNPPVLVFEDLREQGFTLLDEPFNFQRTSKVIRKLAKFHALSFHMENKVEKYRSVFLADDNQDSMDLPTENIRALIEVMTGWPGYELISDHLKKLIPNLMDNMSELFKPNPPGGFNVLNHGDLHRKNIMLKRQNRGVEIGEIFLIDFQMSFWGSPSIDLIYALYVVGSEEVRERRNELIFIYHQQFLATLDKLACPRKPPTLMDLYLELQRNGLLEVFVLICFLPIFFMDFSSFSIDDMFNTKSEKVKIYRQQIFAIDSFQKIIKKHLPEFLHKGFLN